MSDLPREGSRVRLVGLKNPDLNGQHGVVSGYSRGGERVLVSLEYGAQGLVKVKPKQVEVIEQAPPPTKKPFSNSNTTSSIVTEGSSYHPRSSIRSNLRKMDSNSNLSQNSVRSQSELVEALKAADKLFEKADTSGDGYVSAAEFELYMRRHTKHSDATVREVFRRIDCNHDGMIARDEVRRVFLDAKKGRDPFMNGISRQSDMSFDMKISEIELLECSRDAEILFNRADTSGDGYLSKREFELYMKRHTSHSDLAIRQIFDMMDEDNDGKITREEVRRVFVWHKKQKQGGSVVSDDKRTESGRASMGDLLGLEEDELHELADDVYNMFFLSGIGSQGFWYALIIFGIKASLYVIIAIDLLVNKEFPEESDVSTMVRATQFLLLPVAVAIEEELITTFFVYSNLKWSAGILELNKGAHKWKYHVANAARCLDGLLFLFINTTLLLQAVDILSMFLNFAALMFLQTIDNVSLHLARDGYLTETLESVANDVLLMKLPRNHNERLQLLDTALLLSTFVVLVVAWVIVGLRAA